MIEIILIILAILIHQDMSAILTLSWKVNELILGIMMSVPIFLIRSRWRLFEIIRSWSPLQM